MHQNILFVDDEPQNITAVKDILSEALDVNIHISTTVSDAFEQIEKTVFALIVTDIFIPMGKKFQFHVGPRARKYEENMKHLGGLALLDHLEKLSPSPPILAHTACTDFALLEVLGDHVVAKVPKPAPVDVLLTSIRDIIYPKKEWFF